MAGIGGGWCGDNFCQFCGPAGWLFFLGVMIWLAHILRVPHRLPPQDENLVVVSVDGRVVQIRHCPADSGVMPLSYDTLRITIRTKLSDTQMQISPITGHLIDNCLFPGLFTPWTNIDHANGDRHQDS